MGQSPFCPIMPNLHPNTGMSLLRLEFWVCFPCYKIYDNSLGALLGIVKCILGALSNQQTSLATCFNVKVILFACKGSFAVCTVIES